MKKLILFSILCFSVLPAFSNGWDWAFSSNGLYNVKTALANDGSVYLAGQFYDSCTIKNITYFSPDTTETCLFHFDSNGNLLWFKEFKHVSVINGPYVNGADVYLCFAFNDYFTGSLSDTSPSAFNLCLLGFTSAGTNILYKKEASPGYFEVDDVNFANSQFWISGHYTDTIELSGNSLIPLSPTNIFIARYNISGNLNLLKTLYHNHSFTTSFELKSDDYDNFIVYTGISDSLNVYPDTNLYFADWTSSHMLFFNSSGQFIKYRLAGEYIWNLNDFSVHGNLDYIMALRAEGAPHYAGKSSLLRIDNDSTIDFEHEFYNENYEYPYSHEPWSFNPKIISSDEDKSYIAGDYTGVYDVGPTTLLNKGMFLLCLDHHGNYQRVEFLDDTISPYHLSNISGNSVVVSGYLYGNIQIGPDEISAHTYPGSFIAKYTGDGILNSNEKNDDPGFILYPNPTSSSFSIEFKHRILNNVIINIYNSAGALMFAKKYQDLAGELAEVHDLNLKPGIYMVEIKTDNYRATKKLSVN